MLNPSDLPPEQEYSLKFLHQLLQTRPLAFWGSIWATVALVGAIASFGFLLNPGPVEPPTPQPTTPPVPAQNASPSPVLVPTETLGVQNDPIVVTPPPPPEAEFPLWLFGTVALGCAVGSLLVTQGLRYSTQGRKTIKRVKPKPGAVVRKKRRSPAQKKKQQHTVPIPATVVTPQPQVFQPETNVTVLPPEEKPPQNWGNQGLAEMMDIRKRHSLSSLLQDR